MLKRKMLRDIVNYRVQFISIFLMAFIGVLVFTGMFVDTASFETTIDDYYEETNLADGWIYSNYLVNESLEHVYLLGPTTQMERQLVVDSKAQLEGSPDMRLHFVENNTISKFYLLEGSKLDLDDSEGVWLDKSFADSRNLKVGDEIVFESNGTSIRKVIRGLGYSPEYVYDSPVASTVPDHYSAGFAYMSHKAFPGDIVYNVLNVKFDGSPETYKQLLDYHLGDYYTLFLPRSSHYSVDVVAETISQQSAMSSVFPVIFILTSLLMLLTTIKRIISHQRTQLGILKANGLKNNKLLMHFLLYGFIMVTAGSILGAIIGPIVFHVITYPSRIFYFKFPFWHSSGFVYQVLVVLVMAALSLEIPYYSIRRILNEASSLMVKPKPPASADLSFVERLKIWKRIPFNFRWNYRNIKRNKFRSVMTIVGVMGCTVLLISGFGLYEQMDESREWYFDDVDHFESKIMIDGNVNRSEIDSITRSVDGVPIMEMSIEVFGNKTTMASLLVMDNNNLLTMTDDSHNKVEIPADEVSISKRMAEILGVGVGDTINCRILGSNRDTKIRIDRIHSSPFSQGLVMSPEKLEELGLNYSPTSILTSSHVNESFDGMSVVYKDDLINGWNRMEETSMMITFSLIFFAVVLAMIILYNLNVLYFTEMEKDIATLKVLGIKTGYLSRLMATQSLLFIIVGFLLGLPVAYYVLSIVLPAFGDNFYMIPSISFLNMAISFMIIIFTFTVASILFERNIRKLDMVLSLKGLDR